MKKKLFYLCLGTLLVCACFWLRYRLVNRQFYKFVQDIKSEYSYVEDVQLENFGPHCVITVHMDKNYCDYEILEKVFIKVMVEICKEVNFQYFVEKYNEKIGGSPAFFTVIFYQEGIDNEELCRYTSYKDFEVWELESDRSVKFYVSDYLQ